jgi:hypothetical protein
LCNFCYHIGLSKVDEVMLAFAPAISKRDQTDTPDSRQLTVWPDRIASQRAINNKLSG